MDRITTRYAEQQLARLAKATGNQMHYTHQRKDFTPGPDMAEAAPYAEEGAWVVDQSALGGWVNLYQYTGGGGGLSHVTGSGAMKAAGWWDAARFALDILTMVKADA